MAGISQLSLLASKSSLRHQVLPEAPSPYLLRCAVPSVPELPYLLRPSRVTLPTQECCPFGSRVTLPTQAFQSYLTYSGVLSLRLQSYLTYSGVLPLRLQSHIRLWPSISLARAPCPSSLSYPNIYKRRHICLRIMGASCLFIRAVSSLRMWQGSYLTYLTVGT